MECYPDGVLESRPIRPSTSIERGQWVTLLMTGVLLILLLWNLLYGALAFDSMPRNDFGRPLMAAQLFLRGADMYGETEAVRYRYRFDQDTVILLWDLSPPHAHLVYLPLAAMSQWNALAVWFAFSGLCLYASMRIIISEVGVDLAGRGREWMALWLLSFSGMAVAIVTAHMSFVFMLLVTLAWRDARRGEWGKGGCWLGIALSLKPFLLIFGPYLLLKGCWRGLLGMAIAVALSFSVGVLVFGIESHRSWLAMLARADSWAWLPLNASLYGMISRACIENAMFTSAWTMDPGCVRTVWMLLAIPVGFVAMLRAVSESILAGTDRAFAILLVTAVLLSPLGWVYYFWLPVGPIAAIAHSWWVDRRDRSSAEPGRLGSICAYLFGLAMLGMAIPTYLVTSLQPSAVATLLIGSIPFWSLALVWLALILDRLDPRTVRAWVKSIWIEWQPGRWLGHKLASGAR